MGIKDKGSQERHEEELGTSRGQRAEVRVPGPAPQPPPTWELQGAAAERGL